MIKPTRPAANGFVANMRKLYNPLGFSKGYNFILWFTSIGYIVGFTLARLKYFSFHGIFCNPEAGAAGAAPGECFYYLKNPFKIGMMLHLFCIIPAGFLVCFQFVPAIRHKVILFHRINGYMIILLSLVASAGAIIVVPHAFGGHMDSRTLVGVLVISTTLSYLFAWINIKRPQIDQHRAWMMRAWAYFSSIITLHLIMFISAAIRSSTGGFYEARPCAQINWLLGRGGTLALYPGCQPFYNGTNLDQEVVVEANFGSQDPMQLAASLGVNFGSAGWLAFWLHAILIEFYLRSTPAEAQRLRHVSYKRQLERGYKHPGSASLVAQRLGDASPYVPVSQKHNSSNGEQLHMLNDARRYEDEGEH